MKDDASHHLNQFKRENDSISMGYLKVKRNIKDYQSHYLHLYERLNDNIYMGELNISIS